MAFSSGTFSLYTPGNPVVTGTTIAISWANNTLNDIATGLSTCILKDGSQTITANIPMSGFKFTGLGAGSASGNSIRYEQVNGVVTAAGDLIYASAAGTFARLAVAANGSMLALASGLPAYQAMATQADQETATSVLAPVTPGRQQYHPSAAKFWAQFADAGTAALGASYNVSSIDDDGTGDYGLNFTTAMSSVNYAATGMSDSTGNRIILLNSNQTTSIEIDVKVCTTGAASDAPWGAVIGCGDI